MKLKKKYNMLIQLGVINNIYEEKMEISEDTSVNISYIGCNWQYSIYKIILSNWRCNQKSRKLTLLSPDYCDLLSYILKLLFKRVTKRWVNDEDIIPKKGEVLKDMNKSIILDEYKLVKEIHKVNKSKLPEIFLSIDDRQILIWDLIERFIHVVVGGRVRSYR